VKNRGRPTTSPILPGAALRFAVASVAATAACSGSLGGLGGGTQDGGGAFLSGAGSSNASVGNGSTVAPSSASSSSSSAANAGSAGSSSSGGGSSVGASASATSQSSSSSGSSSSDAADASVAADARADAADAAALSFANDVYPIIAARCIACHVSPGDGGVADGHLDMTTNGATGAYAQLVNVAGMGDVAGTSGVTCKASGLIRVVPGSHLTSILYGKVESKFTGGPAPCGNPMPEPDTQLLPTDPPIAEPLSMPEITTIANWIDEGALP